MPKEYEPSTFSRSQFPTVYHYRAYIKSLNADPKEVADTFCLTKLDQNFEEKQPRIHLIEIDREFYLWGFREFDNLQYKISNELFHRFTAGNFGRSKQSAYALNYYEDLIVREPLSQSLIKLYSLPNGNSPCCPKCQTPLDIDHLGEQMECLVCLISEKKARYYDYHRMKNREARNRQIVK